MLKNQAEHDKELKQKSTVIFEEISSNQSVKEGNNLSI